MFLRTTRTYLGSFGGSLVDPKLHTLSETLTELLGGVISKFRKHVQARLREILTEETQDLILVKSPSAKCSTAELQKPQNT